MLDPSTRRQIRVALEHLGCRDLYDALGVLRNAPASHIAARADAERQRWMKKAQVTAEKTAWLEIITHAQSHLGTPKARARYDRTLALETEESFESPGGVRHRGTEATLTRARSRPLSMKQPRREFRRNVPRSWSPAYAARRA